VSVAFLSACTIESKSVVIPAPTPGPNQASRVVLPVVPCSSSSATEPSTGSVWSPSKLTAQISTTAARSLDFYSADSETILAPRGWACSQENSTDGSSAIAAYPPGISNPLLSEAVSPGSHLVTARFDYTTHLPGFDLVCEYFRQESSTASTEFSSSQCTSSIPSGEQVSHVTTDIVSIFDPPGTKGNLQGSGGSDAVTGVAIWPQLSNGGRAENVTEESCSLSNASLCPSILNDFLIRDFPVPSQSGY
jgi:hypothetical protein